MSQLITRQKPFPSFVDVRADLRLAELNMAPPSAPPLALVASTPPRTPTPTAASSRPPPTVGGTPAGGNNGRGRCRRGGRGQGSSAGSPQPTGGPPGGPQWPSFLNPWTGSIHMWPGSSSGRSHGPPPHPGQPPQQAMMAGPAAPGTYYPPAPAAFYQPPAPVFLSAWSPWNPQALANAFNTVSLTPPPSTSDWVVDSGASSHIASNSGMVTLSLSSSFPSSIVVGNGATLPVVGTGYSTLPSPFHLNNVLVAPSLC